MSADNGVYIGRFTKDNGYEYEYRVTHAQAIENCDYDKNYPTELIHAYRTVYYGYGRSEIYDEEGAWERARKLYEEILDGEYPICEYGVSEIHYDEPFPDMTTKEASDYIDEYWDNENRKK